MNESISEQRLQACEHTFTCVTCEREEKREIKTKLLPPRNWVKMPNGLWCDKCRKSKLECKPVSLPVVGIVELTGPDGKTDWKVFREKMRPALFLSTAIANSCIEWLKQKDIIRTPAGYYLEGKSYVLTPTLNKKTGRSFVKMPGLPDSITEKALQDFIATNYPGLDSQTRSTIVRSSFGHYTQYRYEIIWVRNRKLSQFKFPYPLPFPSKDVRLEQMPDGRFSVRLRILSGEAYTLILSKAVGHSYHFNKLEQVIKGEASMRQASVYYEKSRSLHKDGIVERHPITRNKQMTEVWVGINVMRPKPQASTTGKIVEMYVRTDADSLVCCHRSENDVWRVNGQHLKTKIIGYHIARHRLQEDRKKTSCENKARHLGARLSEMGGRHNVYINNYLKQCMGDSAEYCKKRGVTVVKYDDSDKSFLSQFPWVNMRNYLKNAVESRGMEFEVITVENDTEELNGTNN